MLAIVPFGQKVDAALKGKGPFEQLNILAALIQDAEDQRLPKADTDRARRRWLEIYETTYAERIPA